MNYLIAKSKQKPDKPNNTKSASMTNRIRLKIRTCLEYWDRIIETIGKRIRESNWHREPHSSNMEISLDSDGGRRPDTCAGNGLTGAIQNNITEKPKVGVGKTISTPPMTAPKSRRKVPRKQCDHGFGSCVGIPAHQNINTSPVTWRKTIRDFYLGLESK